MESDKIFKEVIQELALQYRNSASTELFERILVRVDNLVLSVVHKCLSIYPHLLLEDLDDVYNVALIGLHNGLLKVKETETIDQTIARLIAYIKCAIKVEFPYKPLPEAYIRTQNQVDLTDPGDSVFSELEYEFIQEALQHLVDEDILTQKELDLVNLRYRDDLSCGLIAKHLETTEGTVRKHVQDALLRIQQQFRFRGIE